MIIRLTSKYNADPDIDRQGCYKAGMAIGVVRDGWKWSKTELSWPYKILKLPGVPEEDVQKWLEPEYEDPEVPADKLVVYRRRRYVFDTVQLTPQLDASLANAITPAATRIAALDAISNDMTSLEPHG